MDDLGRDPVYNIANRLDHYEISGLRSQSHNLNQLLTDIQFAVFYNGGLGHPVWIVNQYLTDSHPNLGCLVLIRESDSHRVDIAMDRFPLRHMVSEDAYLTFLGCNGSFFLFNVFQTTRLIVVNLSNGVCHQTPLLPLPVRLTTSFVEKNDTKIVPIGDGFDYYIIHYNYTPNLVTMLAYSSRTNMWYREYPALVHTLTGSNHGDVRSMVLTDHGSNILVSVRNGSLVFRRGFIGNLAPIALVQPGVVHITSRGAQGWFMAIQFVADMWKIYLFKLNENWERYDFVSQAPNFQRYPVWGRLIGLHHLEETEGSFHFRWHYIETMCMDIWCFGLILQPAYGIGN